MAIPDEAISDDAGRAGFATRPVDPTGRQTVLLAVGQGALMFFGGVLALLVAHRFGKTESTDAFFASYGLYSVGLTFAQTFRVTAVAKIVSDRGGVAVTELLGAAGLMALALAVPMVVFAATVGDALVAGDPYGVAPDALRILWVALTGQLLAAMLATVLAVRGSFNAIGVATLASGLVTLGAFHLVVDDLGINAAPFALAASSAWLVLVPVVVLLRGGWRLERGARFGATWAAAGRLTYASSTFIGMNVAYVIAIVFAGREGAGQATVFAYAYVIGAVLIGLTSNVTSATRSPGIVASDDRVGEAEATGLWSFRFTVLLVGPVIGLLIVLGTPAIGLALGPEFSDADVRDILMTSMALLGWLLSWSGGVFAVVELLARNELRRLAGLAVIQVVAVAVVCAVAGAVGGVVAVGASLSLVQVAVGVVQLRWAFGGRASVLGRRMFAILGREVLLVGLALLPAAVLTMVAGNGFGVTLAAGAMCAVLLAAGTWFAWPQESRSLLGVLRR